MIFEVLIFISWRQGIFTICFLLKFVLIKLTAKSTKFASLENYCICGIQNDECSIRVYQSFDNFSQIFPIKHILCLLLLGVLIYFGIATRYVVPSVLVMTNI